MVDPAATASSSAPTTTVAAVAANRAAALATANTVTQVHPQVYHMPGGGDNDGSVEKVVINARPLITSFLFIVE